MNAQLRDIDKIFEKHKLKKTKIRRIILGAFLRQNHALSYNDLADLIEQKIDKSTIYRNLTKLEENEVIHSVENTTGVLKYALGKQSNSKDQQHAHFQCNECQEVYCIPQAEVNLTKLPSDFQIESINVNFKGICNKCKVS